MLLIGDAASEDEIGRRLADDPWERAKRLVTVSVEPWNLLVGAARLGNAHTPRDVEGASDPVTRRAYRRRREPPS